MEAVFHLEDHLMGAAGGGDMFISVAAVHSQGGGECMWGGTWERPQVE